MSNPAARRQMKVVAPSHGFSAPQKAALIIAALGPEAAGPIIERIGDQHLRAFARAFGRLDRVPRAELVAVIEEFVGNLRSADGEVKGGYEGASALLAHFKSEDAAARLLDEAEVPGGRTVWQKLETVKDEAIAGYLSNLHPQAAAVVLSRLDVDKASAVLANLDGEISQELVARLARGVNVRREALRVLGDAVERDFLAPMRNASRARRPGETVGAMMNNMSAEKRDKLLGFIQTKAPEIYEEVKAQILTFQDLPSRVPPQAVPAIVRGVEADQFLKAVKLGRQNAPETVEFIFANISQRMGQQYQEQIDALSQVTAAEAEAAQGAMMTAVRRLVAAGEFQLIKPQKAEEQAYI
jgi:flagellar motor switch protein FliG